LVSVFSNSGFVCEFGGEDFGKKKRESVKNRGLWEGRALVDSFFFIIQNPPNFEGTQKLYWKRFYEGL
jgi:hypothetical protein